MIESLIVLGSIAMLFFISLKVAVLNDMSHEMRDYLKEIRDILKKQERR